MKKIREDVREERNDDMSKGKKGRTDERVLVSHVECKT